SKDEVHRNPTHRPKSVVLVVLPREGLGSSDTTGVTGETTPEPRKGVPEEVSKDPETVTTDQGQQLK
ncbi:Hypothetical predicted protein, partial [Marmota monax]